MKKTVTGVLACLSLVLLIGLFGCGDSAKKDDKAAGMKDEAVTLNMGI